MIFFYFNLLESFYFNQRIIIYFRVNIPNTTIFEPVILTDFYTTNLIKFNELAIELA